MGEVGEEDAGSVYNYVAGAAQNRSSAEQHFNFLRKSQLEHIRKLRSNLTDNNLCSILRLATTKLEPNVDKVVDSIQAQPLTED